MLSVSIAPRIDIVHKHMCGHLGALIAVYVVDVYVKAHRFSGFTVIRCAYSLGNIEWTELVLDPIGLGSWSYTTCSNKSAYLCLPSYMGITQESSNLEKEEQETHHGWPS